MVVIGRLMVCACFIGAVAALWLPFTVWEGPGGRKERWGVLGYRDVSIRYLSGPGGGAAPVETTEQAVVRPLELVGTVALTVAAGAAAVFALRALDVRRVPPPPPKRTRPWYPADDKWK